MNTLLTIIAAGILVAVIVLVFYIIPDLILTTSKNKQLQQGVKAFIYTVATIGFGIFLIGMTLAINYFMNQ